MTPGRIDDPFEASFETWPDESENTPGEAALTVAGVFSEVVAVFALLRDHFSIKSKFDRVNYLFRGAGLKFRELDRRMTELGSELADVKARIASPAFREAATIAVEEAARAANFEKIDQISNILVGSVDPRITSDSPADAASLIRDIAQLSQTDLQVLRHLEAAYGSLFPSYPNVHDPNIFTDKIQDFKDAIRRSGLHSEEF